MSFTRFNYDDCRVKKKLQESTGPGRYMLNKPGWGANPYVFSDPQMRIGEWGGNVPKNMGHPIDIETKLSNRNVKLSKYGCGNKYNHNITKSYVNVSYPVHSKCTTEESRVSHPAFTYVEKEIDRSHPLLLDPQANTVMEFKNNLNTRLLERDNFKPKIPCLN